MSKKNNTGNISDEDIKKYVDLEFAVMKGKPGVFKYYNGWLYVKHLPKFNPGTKEDTDAEISSEFVTKINDKGNEVISTSAYNSVGIKTKGRDSTKRKLEEEQRMKKKEKFQEDTATTMKSASNALADLTGFLKSSVKTDIDRSMVVNVDKKKTSKYSVGDSLELIKLCRASEDTKNRKTGEQLLEKMAKEALKGDSISINSFSDQSSSPPGKDLLDNDSDEIFML